MRLGAGALLLAAALGLTQPAAADDAILLEVPDCAGVSGATVRGIVAIEVSPRAVLPPASAAAATTRGTLECEGTVARIVVEDVQRAEPLRLEIALGELAAAARPRLLALAIAELIATSRLERTRVAAAPVPAPVEPQPTAAEESAEASAGPAVPPSLQVWLALAAVREAEPAVLAPSIALGAVQSWDQLALVLDVRYERGQRAETEVELGFDVVSIALGPAGRLHGRSYQLLLGAALRVGYASLRAKARAADLEGDSLGGAWFGPCGQAALQFQVAPGWGVRLGGEVGYFAREIEGLGVSRERVLGLHGVWVAAMLGVGVEVWEARD